MPTVRGFEVTVQFCATPLSCTEWSPGDNPLIVTVVLVVTFRLPVVAVHVTEKVAVVLEPTSVTGSGFFVLTVQFDATPLSWTTCAPSSTPLNVVLPLVGRDWLLVRSSVAV